MPTLVYDPADTAVRHNPFPIYTRLQDEDPLHWSPALRSWVLTRYEDVRAAILSKDLSPDRLRPFYAQLSSGRQEVLSEVMRYLNLWLVFRDPPEHTRLRRLMNTVFTPRAILAMQPQIEAVVVHILDRLPADRPIDIVRDLAMPLPAYVILDMLGIDRARFEDIKHWSDDMRAFIGSSRGSDDKYARARSGADKMSGFFREVIAERRATPGSDFVSRMITARDEEGALSEDELVATCMLVLFAGHETTTNLISNAVNALLDHPDQLRRLLDQPALMPQAVEEFLRYDGPSNAIARVVAVEHVLHGQTLKPGDRVFAMVNAANRDPRQFEQPQALDLGRSPNRHLTFGHGLHFCLGAPLARLEAQACLSVLLQRFPRLARAPGEVDWIDALVMRGLTTLPVRLS